MAATNDVDIAQPTQAPAPVRMSHDEYLQWEHEGSLAEWVDGEVIIHMPPTITHQRIVVFLTVLLATFTRLNRVGEVLSAPLTMRATPQGNAREPDIVFVATEHLDRLTQQRLDGPADLVVEVISTESVSRDRDEKFFEYQAAGVREYWIVDPRDGRRRADFFVLDQVGTYQPVPLPTDGVYHSTVVPSFWLNVAWLWQDDPNPLTALAEIVGVEALVAGLRGA